MMTRILSDEKMKQTSDGAPGVGARARTGGPEHERGLRDAEGERGGDHRARAVLGTAAFVREGGMRQETTRVGPIRLSSK
mgnify:CR=1 FL=1|jgi:hypothetical protein